MQGVNDHTHELPKIRKPTQLHSEFGLGEPDAVGKTGEPALTMRPRRFLLLPVGPVAGPALGRHPECLAQFIPCDRLEHGAVPLALEGCLPTNSYESSAKEGDSAC